MANIVQMMQKAQQMKLQLQEMQERVRHMEMDGEAGGGLVRCRVNGRFELKTLKIDPSIINPKEPDVLEDLIIAAVNDARAQAEKVMTDETARIMQGLGLPPGFDLPL